MCVLLYMRTNDHLGVLAIWSIDWILHMVHLPEIQWCVMFRKKKLKQKKTVSEIKSENINISYILNMVLCIHVQGNIF